MMDLKKICREIEVIAREAGDFIRKEASGFDIRRTESKGLNNFVSYVDKGSEKIIVSRLRELLPGSGFMAEEGTVEEEAARFTWVIDPLDGTTNFLHGLPPFAISIGLMEYDEIIAGVVYEVTGDEMFTAWKNGGAWLNNKRISVSSTAKIADSLVATGFPYSDFTRLERYMNCLAYFCKNTHGIRRLGSAATDIVYIACGRFEAFYEYGLHPWDIAAAIIILREAGGIITDFSGNGKKLNGDEIVAANNSLHAGFLEIVSKFMVK